MAENPWLANQFYEGGFFTDQPEYDVTDPLRDQRQAILMEIEGIKQVSMLTFSINLGSPTAPIVQFYIWLDSSGNLQGTDDLSTYVNPGDVRWQFINGMQQMRYLVMIDALGNEKYIQATNSPTPTLTIQASVPITSRGKDDAHYVGPYIEMIAEDGISIYRLTINAMGNLVISLDRTEPERIQSITISNGHPWAFRNGRTFIETLVEFGDVDTQLETTILGFGGMAEPRIGIFRISLHDSEFDFLTWQDWDGRKFTVWIGSTDEDILLYGIAVRGEIQSAEWDQDHLTLHVRDAGIRFNRPMQENVYAGTGGLEGGEELTGMLKPLMYGEVLFAEPVLINGDLHIYQFHDGPMHEIAFPYQGGVYLTVQGDFPGQLETWEPTAADVSAGAVRTDLSLGMMRLAAPPGGRIGAFRAIGDSGLPVEASISEIIQYILQNRMSDISIDINSFILHHNTFPRYAGIYIKEEKTVRDTITSLINSVGGSISLDRLGSISIHHGLRREPVAYIYEKDIVEGSIRRVPVPEPGIQHKFGYQKIYTVYTESDLLGAADPLFRLFAHDEYRYISYGGPYPDAIANKYPSGISKTIPTFYNLSGPVESYAPFLIHREQALRDVYYMTLYNFSWKLNVGDTIMLELSRWGMNVPRIGIIIGVTERSPTFNVENTTTIRVWC